MISAPHFRPPYTAGAPGGHQPPGPGVRQTKGHPEAGEGVAQGRPVALFRNLHSHSSFVCQIDRLSLDPISIVRNDTGPFVPIRCLDIRDE